MIQAIQKEPPAHSIPNMSVGMVDVAAMVSSTNETTIHKMIAVIPNSHLWLGGWLTSCRNDNAAPIVIAMPATTANRSSKSPCS